MTHRKEHTVNPALGDAIYMEENIEHASLRVLTVKSHLSINKVAATGTRFNININKLCMGRTTYYL